MNLVKNMFDPQILHFLQHLIYQLNPLEFRLKTVHSNAQKKSIKTFQCCYQFRIKIMILFNIHMVTIM